MYSWIDPNLASRISITVGQSYYIRYTLLPVTRCYPSMTGQYAYSPLGKPCKACACSGWYVDYGGFSVGGVLVPCKECKGVGYLTDQSAPKTP